MSGKIVKNKDICWKASGGAIERTLMFVYDNNGGGYCYLYNKKDGWFRVFETLPKKLKK